jgi:DNA-binding PadR family transcriptional regulator
MYGYEIIRELEKRFSGYWKPKTGTIYPALEKLEQNKLVTSRIEFRENAPDRKHYALTGNGQAQLGQSMAYWTKMTEVLENYRETHESIFRYKSEVGRRELSELLIRLGQSLKESSLDASKVFAAAGKRVRISPTEPIALKFLYAKEHHKLEIHMEFEWIPRRRP